MGKDVGTCTDNGIGTGKDTVIGNSIDTGNGIGTDNGIGTGTDIGTGSGTGNGNGIGTDSGILIGNGTGTGKFIGPENDIVIDNGIGIDNGIPFLGTTTDIRNATHTGLDVVGVTAQSRHLTEASLLNVDIHACHQVCLYIHLPALERDDQEFAAVCCRDCCKLYVYETKSLL